MNFIELDKKLHALTTSETRYLKNPTLSPIYQKAMQITFDDRLVYNFSKKYFNLQDDYFINKHSRFIPVPEHIHENIELNFVYSGECIQFINNKKIHLYVGDIVLIDTGIPHSIEPTGEDDIIINLLINQIFFTANFSQIAVMDSYLSQFLMQAISHSQKHNQYLIFRNTDTEKLSVLFKQLLCEHYDPGVAARQIKDLYIKLIFLELIRSFSVEVNGTHSSSSQIKFALSILEYIDKNYESCTLTECAHYFGYNSSYFSNRIKQITGMTFKEMVIKKRLEKSCTQLVHSQKNIKDIALDNGFSNLNQFYKIFEKEHKMTPSEFRRLHQQKNEHR